MWKNLALVGASLPMNESHIDEHILGMVTHPLTKYWENALSLSGGIPRIFAQWQVSPFLLIGIYLAVSSLSLANITIYPSLFGQYLASHV